MSDEKDMSNTSNLKAVTRKAFATIMSVRNDRIDLNELMQDAREMMDQAGVAKPVFAMMQQYLLMSAQNRENFREFFDIITDVIDEDFKPTLFDAEKQKKQELAKARKEKNAPPADPKDTEEE